MVTGRTVQNHADPNFRNPQNTKLDVLNPTILFIWRETAGKGKTFVGFHPTKLSVGPTTTRAGIIFPHTPGGCGGKRKEREERERERERERASE